MRVIFLVGTAALLACSCSSMRTRPQEAQAKPVRAEALAQAAAEESAIASALGALARDKANYRISPADLLTISIYREDDLSRTLRVSASGEVSMPLVGTIGVGGKSIQEAQALLAQRYAEYLVNPQITVFIKEYGNKKVFILGEVKNPGSFELPPESKLTVLEAISMAGGFTQIAAKDRTRVIRADTGKSQSWTVEVTAITSRGEKEKDISLEPNDVVYVPQTFF